MPKRIILRILGIALIATGISAYLIVAIAEATSYALIQCVDYPAGSEGVNAGCHLVSDTTPEALRPIMNEGFKIFTASLSIVGSLVLVATELGFRRKRVEGASPNSWRVHDYCSFRVLSKPNLSLQDTT